MRYAVLGPLVVSDGSGRASAIAASKQRQALATLLAHANEVRSADQLVDAVWGEAPPASARKIVQGYVLQLRRVGVEIATVPGGYVVRADADDLDAARFERATSDARVAMLRGRFAEAVERFTQGLALWRGSAYADVEHDGRVALEALRLEALRIAATEDLLEARIGSGDHAGATAALEELVGAHPERERAWGLLMVALYRSGRQAEALDAYRRAREALVDAFGIEPGPALRELEAAVYSQDPSLSPQRAFPGARYVTTADGVDVAYSTHGDGPDTVVFCAEATMNLELMWEMDGLRPFLERLAGDGKLVAVQRRGTGLSDRAPGRSLTPPETCIPDVDAVLAEVGCERAAFVGWGHGGQVALAYAAARPDRVERLAVVNGYARQTAIADYPHGTPPEAIDMFLAGMEGIWGAEVPKVGIFDPSVASDPALIRRIARLERLTASPREAVAHVRALANFDVRSVLDRVRCPVLVVFLSQSITGRENARYLADVLPSARFVELEGWFVPKADEARVLADEVASFLSQR